MKRNFIPQCLIILALAAFAGNCVAQTKTVIKETSAHGTTSWTGEQLYKEFCAVCHGADGKGAGPAASALKVSPTDLTQETRHSGSKFPDLKLRSVINGVERIGAHGTTEMPIWGDIFKSISANPTFGQMRVEALVRYIQTIQR